VQIEAIILSKARINAFITLVELFIHLYTHGTAGVGADCDIAGSQGPEKNTKSSTNSTIWFSY
jgi:hypothetical protein